MKPRGKGLRALLKNPKGLEVFGLWGLLLQAATETTKPEMRGKLLNHKDEPACIEEIAEAVSLDRQLSKVKRGLAALVELGWVEYVPCTEEVQNKSVEDTENPSHKISKVKSSKVKLSKNIYLNHVRLTKEEYEKLVVKFGQTGADDWIKTLDDGIALKGYKYKSHYLAILKWSKNSNSQSQKPKRKSAAQAMDEYEESQR